MANNQFCSCPTNCTPVALPVLPTTLNCVSTANVRLSQLNRIVLQPLTVTAPTIAQWNTAAYWATAINNATAGNTVAKIIAFGGYGSIAEPTLTNLEMGDDTSIIIKRTYRLEFTIQNLEPTIRTFIKTLQCGDKGFRMWYSTKGGSMYGGVGINVDSINAFLTLGGGTNDVETYKIVITFTACGDPDWAVNILP